MSARRLETGDTIDAVVILGSGLAGAFDEAELETVGELATGVAGHPGRLALWRFCGHRVLVALGRRHLYEGIAPAEAAATVERAASLGARHVVVTNAAGGLDPRFGVGDIMLIDGVNSLLLGNRLPLLHVGARDAAVRDGAAHDGTAGEATLDECVTINRTSRERAARDGAVREAADRDSTSRERAAREGAGREAADREGTSRERAAREGAVRDGADREGTSREGAAHEGTAQEGAAHEGEAFEAATHDAAAHHFAFDADRLRAVAQAAIDRGVPLVQGAYAAVPGPSYETRAEIRMLRMMGASAVGMSTVPEVIAAQRLGLSVTAFSLITNTLSDTARQELDHADVVVAGARAQRSMRLAIEAALLTP